MEVAAPISRLRTAVISASISAWAFVHADPVRVGASIYGFGVNPIALLYPPHRGSEVLPVALLGILAEAHLHRYGGHPTLSSSCMPSLRGLFIAAVGGWAESRFVGKSFLFTLLVSSFDAFSAFNGFCSSASE